MNNYIYDHKSFQNYPDKIHNDECERQVATKMYRFSFSISFKAVSAKTME